MSAGCYATFCAGVAQRQLSSWLSTFAGHEAIVDVSPGAPSRELHPRVVSLMAAHPQAARGDCVRVIADEELLDCLGDQSIAGIVAERGALARWLVTEETLSRAFRVLRPGGRILLCVESLRHGLAELAAAGRWAQLADAPHADVVLLPTGEGQLRRCFTPEELHAALTDAGFVVDWIRPRTVLPPEAIERAVATDPGALPTMIDTELRLAAEWAGEIAGSWLLASATRPG